MNTLTDISNTLSALSSVPALTIFQSFDGEPLTVDEIATRTDLDLNSIKSGIKMLRNVHLLRLDNTRKQRCYAVNENRLKMVKQALQSIEKPMESDVEEAADRLWVNALDYTDQQKKVLYHYAPNQFVQELPAKQIKQHTIAKWMATFFELDRDYTEPQINAILQAHCYDYVTMRRMLIDFKYLDRTRDCSLYWKLAQQERPSIEEIYHPL